MKRLIVRSLAEAEIEEAYLWYLDHSAGAARGFLDELEDLFARITENPAQYPEVRVDLRRARMPRYPFGIYFTVVGEIVSVIGVIHARRHPRVWLRRA